MRDVVTETLASPRDSVYGRGMTTTTYKAGDLLHEWVIEHGEKFVAVTALDNYEPTRMSEMFDCYRYSTDTVENGIVIFGTRSFRNSGRGCVFLFDDGTSVKPYYVAAFHPDGHHLILHPFPLNVNEDGSLRMRADRDEPVDYSHWSLGPSLAYHMKARSAR